MTLLLLLHIIYKPQIHLKLAGVLILVHKRGKIEANDHILEKYAKRSCN